MSVGRASPGAAEQVGDQLDIIFQQRGRLRRTCLAEAARLGALRGKLSRRAPGLAFHRIHLRPGHLALPASRWCPPGDNPKHIFLIVSKCSEVLHFVRH